MPNDPIINSTGIKVSHILTNDDEINSLPIRNGSLYLCTDSGDVYYDINGERKKQMGDTLRGVDAKLSDFNNTLSNMREEIDDIIDDSIDDYIQDATDEDIDALFEN